MAAPRPLNPEAIDRRLRQAGHPRHDGRTRMTRYSVGYTLDWARGAWPSETVLVQWDGGHDSDPGNAREALKPLAATLTAAGYAVEADELIAHVDDGEFRFPCLIVQTREG